MPSVPRILLAEGHGPTRDLVAATLSQAGFEVLAAEDAARAYEVFAAERPDAVVLAADVSGDAVALAQRMREANPRVLLVVTDREHLGKARGLPALLPLKANAYVADPTQRVLLDKLQQLVAQREPEPPRGAARVLVRPPSSKGEVKAGVVPRLFHQIWRSLSEGILVVDGAGPARQIGFRQGVPVMVTSDDPDESLLRWLRQSGRIDPAAQDAALEAMASGLSAGAALIAAGVVEPGPPLQALLVDHLRALVLRTVGARDGRWRFHPGGEFASDGPAVEILPLQAILEGARLGLPARHFADSLKAVTLAYPVRTGDFPQVLPAAGLSSSDLRLALSLDGRLTMRDWLAARAAEMKEALSLLWFLSMVGAVAFQEEPLAEDAYGRPPLARKRRPLPAERGEAIRQAALRILPGTHLAALGLDLDADAAAVEQAYRTVAARFHPDGFAEYEVAELQDLLSAIQDKLAAAYRVLSDDDRRRAYLEYLLQRLEQTGARRPGVDLLAEFALKRGQRALHRRRHGEAVLALREAVQRNGREPEYLAMLAFALLFDPALSAAEGAEEARKLAKKALALAPDHPRASAALALAEEALGDVAEARRVTLAALKEHAASELLKRVLFRLNRVRG
jgi:CheY-like chemotaxis protein